jgi:hypothetical protein
MYDQNRDVKSARWDKNSAASKSVEAELYGDLDRAAATPNS